MKSHSRGVHGFSPPAADDGIAMSHPASETADFKVVDSRLMMKLFYGFAAVALMSVAISLAGKWFGQTVAMGGNTTDTTLHEIVIGNNVIVAPANAIRFDRARRDGLAARLDLYLRYPQMEGYSLAARGDFDRTGPGKNIIFLSFEEQLMSRDMSGRFAPIYSTLIVKPGTSGPAGLTSYEFSEKSGYLNETLAVAERPGATPFVARCLAGPGAAQSLAPCERDILVGERLSLTYRFPKELLADWKELDAAVAAKAATMLKTGGSPLR
jgi:hypothetical protein